MSIFDRIIETETEEAARLAQSPVGSSNHRMSQLPVTLAEYPYGMVVELPENQGVFITVAPITHQGTPRNEGVKILHNGYWTAVVVASNHENTPVGQTISVSDSEIRRSKRVELDQRGPMIPRVD